MDKESTLKLRKDLIVKAEKKFVKLIIKTHFSFVICWLPYSILGILQLIDEASFNNYLYHALIFLVAFLNSIINPLIFFHHQLGIKVPCLHILRRSQRNNRSEIALSDINKETPKGN